jgi:DNA-binding IscR family transcriptional regulator
VRPPGALGDSPTRVLLAVADGYNTTGRITAATGLSRTYVFWCLRLLRDEGLVDWVPGTQGTIHSLVTEANTCAMVALWK